MKYRNAGEFLPHELLAELQQHAEGELIYVPNRGQNKARWGTRNGSRERYTLRNLQMVHHYKQGDSIEELSRKFFLSQDSIKKIIRANVNGAEQN